MARLSSASADSGLRVASRLDAAGHARAESQRLQRAAVAGAGLEGAQGRHTVPQPCPHVSTSRLRAHVPALGRCLTKRIR